MKLHLHEHPERRDDSISVKMNNYKKGNDTEYDSIQDIFKEEDAFQKGISFNQAQEDDNMDTQGSFQTAVEIRETNSAGNENKVPEETVSELKTVNENRDETLNYEFVNDSYNNKLVNDNNVNNGESHVKRDTFEEIDKVDNRLHETKTQNCLVNEKFSSQSSQSSSESVEKTAKSCVRGVRGLGKRNRTSQSLMGEVESMKNKEPVTGNCKGSNEIENSNLEEDHKERYFPTEKDISALEMTNSDKVSKNQEEHKIRHSESSTENSTESVLVSRLNSPLPNENCKTRKLVFKSLQKKKQAKHMFYQNSPEIRNSISSITLKRASASFSEIVPPTPVELRASNKSKIFRKETLTKTNENTAAECSSLKTADEELENTVDSQDITDSSIRKENKLNLKDNIVSNNEAKRQGADINRSLGSFKNVSQESPEEHQSVSLISGAVEHVEGLTAIREVATVDELEELIKGHSQVRKPNKTYLKKHIFNDKLLNYYSAISVQL